MRRTLGIAGLLALAVTLGATWPLAAAEAPSEKGFLLRYYHTLENDERLDQREDLVFRDGVVIETVKGRFRDLKTHLLIRSQARPESFDKLLKAFTDARIGQQSGNCTYPRLAPRPLQIFTWFGKGQRQNTLLIGTQFKETCSREIQDLLQVIGDFLDFGLTEQQSVFLKGYE